MRRTGTERTRSLPGDGGPAGPRGFGSGELRRVTLGLARLLLDANITARISNKPPLDFLLFTQLKINDAYFEQNGTGKRC